jgi:O-methyltransferase
MCFDERMSMKKAVNDALIRTTGYELRKAKPARVAGLRRSGPSSAPAKAASSASSKPKAETFPKDYDDELVEIIRAVRPYTMTGHDKLHALITATRYIARYKVPGDIVECGVWRGGSMHAVARTLDIAGDRERDLYLYDTFEGMTEPTAHDVRFDGQSASSQLATQDRHESKVWAYASLEDVQAGFETVPYPSERVHFIKGPVEETVPGELPEQIAILRLDTDWYESTAHELTHMYDRLVPGGVLMLDDYGWWQGSKLATEEFLDRTGEQLLLIRMGSGRVAVKR